MYRDPRGSLVHPHRDEVISLGTLMVEKYDRPAWLFNKLLYIEKEGAHDSLKQDGWLEKHDCAVMSTKGFSTRAARDLIDKLAAHGEPIQVFCVHDADASGSMIYQTLQDATKARGARKIEIVNLGLEPWEAVEMGLNVEDLPERQKPQAGRRLHQRSRWRDEDWDEWLQTHRVELNEMTPAQLIAWLDEKMDEHGDGKLIPPDDVMEENSWPRPRSGCARRSRSAFSAKPTSMGRSLRRWRRSIHRTALRSGATSRMVSRTSRKPSGAPSSRRSPTI